VAKKRRYGTATNNRILALLEKPPPEGYGPWTNGRALTGQSHDYKRHGTTTLFAPLEVATGRIIAAHSKRRRRIEFLGFMNSPVATSAPRHPRQSQHA
jgi:hypothetical protein